MDNLRLQVFVQSVSDVCSQGQFSAAANTISLSVG